jgi:hypothetical protein
MPLWPSHSRRHLEVTALLVFLALSPLGCGGGNVSEQITKSFEEAKESVSKGVEQAKEGVQKMGETAKQATTTAKEAAGLSGKMTLSFNPPISTTGAYAYFTAQTGDRNGAIAFQSYSAGQAETFPSVYVRSLTTAKTLNELVGTTVPCEVFVQEKADGPVWRQTAGDAAQLKIMAVEGKLVKAEIQGASLHETSAEQAVTVNGQFEAVLP